MVKVFSYCQGTIDFNAEIQLSLSTWYARARDLPEIVCSSITSIAQL